MSKWRIGFRLACTVSIAVAVLLLGSASSHARGGAFNTSASAVDLAVSIAADPSVVVGAEFVERPSGTPTSVEAVNLASFPTSGPTYAILSSGDASLAGNPNTSGSTGVNLGGAPVRGSSAFDVTILRIDLQVPAEVNCLVGIEFRFLSDEFPEFVGSSFNDAFIAELDNSTWTTSGSTISAPNNFAFDPSGSVISINAAGLTSMAAGESAGTTYDGATPLLTAATPITPGAHSLYLSIFDQGDRIYDSSVFIDNLRLGTVANVATDCVPGAVVVDPDAPTPLVGAHGITGEAADMLGNLNLARNNIDGLRTVSAETGAVTSVFTNAVELVEDSVALLIETNQDSVNVIAHSKGGLDARTAMFLAPDLFDQLGMLATPNGGSTLANLACTLKGAPAVGDSLFADMGPCDDIDDGLFNLQTDWIAEAFNVVVRDSPQHDFWIAAGDCMGPIIFGEGAAKCNATLLAGHNCTDIDGLWGLGDADGENAVCVWSAFAQADGWDPGGLHHALDPIFQGLDHTQVRTSPCPSSLAYAWMYGYAWADNPWLVGDGSGCENLPIAAGLSAQDGAGDPFETEGQPQTLTVVTLDANGQAVVPLTDEGQGGRLLVMHDAGALASAEILGPDGPVQPRIAGGTEVLGVQPAKLLVYGPLAGGSSLVLIGAPGAQVGVVTSVLSTVRADTTLTPNGGLLDVAVSISNASPSTANDTKVTARVRSTGETYELALQSTNGSELVFGGSIPAPVGEFESIDVTVDGLHRRTDTAGVFLPDNTGSIDAPVSSTTADSSGNGAIDTILLDVAVTTATAGDYFVSLQLESGGVVVGTGGAQATLPGGPTVVTIPIGFDELASVALPGPYEVADVTLTSGFAERLIARVESLGITAPIDMAALGDGLTISRPSALAADTNGDGLLDRLTWSSTLWVPLDGTYVFEGVLQGPQGRMLQELSLSDDFTAGMHVVSFDIDGDVIGSHLSGRYGLNNLTVTLSTDASVTDRAPSGFTGFLNVSAWTTGIPDLNQLFVLWREAEASGAIQTNGLFMSQLNRLERIAADLDAGNIDAALAKLNKFRAQIDPPAKIEASAGAAISSYATYLADYLDG